MEKATDIWNKYLKHMERKFGDSKVPECQHVAPKQQIVFTPCQWSF